LRAEGEAIQKKTRWRNTLTKNKPIYLKEKLAEFANVENRTADKPEDKRMADQQKIMYNSRNDYPR